MTRPSAEMNEPEPPELKRTDAFCKCSYQASGLSKPYFCLSCLRGGLLNSHMPSSAGAGLVGIIRGTTARERSQRTRFMTGVSSWGRDARERPDSVGRRRLVGRLLHALPEQDGTKGGEREQGQQLAHLGFEPEIAVGAVDGFLRLLGPV